MASLLTPEEALVAVERVLGGMFEGDEASAWLVLAERSLGIEPGRLVGVVYYPEEYGVPDDATAEELVAIAASERT